jgi:hypothetical protein
MRTVIALLTWVAVSLIAANLIAASDPMEFTAAFLKAVPLTDAQKEQVAELKKQYKPKFAEVQRRQEQIQAGKDPTSPRSLMASLDAQQALLKLVDEFRARLDEVLTPEQKAQLKGNNQSAPRHSRPVASPPGPVVEPAVSGPTEDGRTSGSTEIAPLVDIKLQNVRWQALPEEIQSVAVSPDQRTWYLMKLPSGVMEMQQSAIRQVVEREFAKASPQLQGVQHVFFETAGNQGDERAKLKRTWMLCGRTGKLLLAYDGKSWIERRAKNGHFEEHLPQSRSFFQLDGGVAFLDTAGCHVLQGTNWTYYQYLQRNEKTHATWLDPDARGLTVLTAGEQKKLWRYREGVPSEKPWPSMPYAGARADSPMKLGDYFYVRVGFAQEKLTDPQRASMIRSGLLPAKPVVLRIGLDGEMDELNPQKTITVGRYRIALKCSMGNDRDGTFYADCEEAYDGARKLGPGLVICDLSGTVRYVPASDRPPPDLAQFTAIKVLLDGGKRAWNAAALWDMESLKCVGRLPQAGFQIIAATDDGTAFAGAEPVMVCRLAASDPRQTLSGPTMRVNGIGYCVGSDGCVWASRGDFGLERFDGETWRVAADVKVKLTPHSLIPAQNGWVLTYVGHRVSDLKIEHGMLLNSLFGPQYLLLNGQTCGGQKSFRTWIPEQRGRFLDAFSQPCANCPWYAVRPDIGRQEQDGRIVINGNLDVGGAGVVMDKSKNLWANSFGDVCVVTEKRVIDVAIPPDRTNPSAGPRRAASIALLGDGAFVFLGLNDGNTFFVRLTLEGDVDFSKGPKLWTGGPRQMAYPLRDHQGGLWLTVDSGKGRGVKDGRETGSIVRRMTAPDKGQDFNDVGQPEMVDASGCVWLASHSGAGHDVFTIWAPSGETTTLRVPGRTSGGSVVAGPKGHVFVPTAFGVQECITQNPDKPAAYTLGTVYHLETAEGELLGNMQYSSLGYLVTTGFRKDAEDSLVLHLFPLGPKRAKNDHASPAPSAENEPQPRAAPAAAKLRTWKDATGSFSVEAEFVGAGVGKVTLRKADGSTIKVPLEKLSAEDQQYIRRRGR